MDNNNIIINTSDNELEEQNRRERLASLFERARQMMDGRFDFERRLGLQKMRKCAELGSLEACLFLGEAYHAGEIVHQDQEESQRWYGLAVSMLEDRLTTTEDIQADDLYELAVCYRRGEGVEQDDCKAFELYAKAAELGSMAAWNNLGVMYETGLGTEPDQEKALICYRTAAGSGNMHSQFLLGRMLFEGVGTEPDYAEAFHWFSKAADQGECDSMFYLSLCYRDGLGVSKDIELSQYYFQSSIDSGSQYPTYEG